MRISRRNNWIGTALALLVLGPTLGAQTASALTSVPTSTTPPPVVHFPTKTPRVHPNKINHGPDGAVWFTEINNASIARMTGSGFTQEFPVPDPNQFLRGITDGPDGAMWFAEEGTCVINPVDPDGDCLDFTDGKIGRITTQGKITEFPVPSANSHPWEIIHGPDGNLWFTEIGDNLHTPGHGHIIEGNKIGRITPQGQITEFPVPTFDSFPNGIINGPDGALWFTENTGNKIGRITTSGVITEFPIPTPNARAIGIAAGLDGNLWFTEQLGQRIGRITPSGHVTEFPLPNGGNPVSITIGPDGAMWFTEVRGQRIGRISADGAISEVNLPPATFPIGITIGPGFHDVWFTEVGPSKIGRIDVCKAPQFRLACASAVRLLRDPRHQPRP